MPQSFALDGDGGVVLQQDSSTNGAPSARVDSVGTGTNQPVVRLDNSPAPQVSAQNVQALAGATGIMENTANAELKTLDGLSKLVGGKLDEIVAQKQQEQYFNGMAMVTQGQALKDIEDQQPWYTKIFGPDATVKGAQAMTIMTKLQDSQTQFLNDMPELRKQDPDVVRQYLVKQASGIDVGDPTVNNMIQSKLAEQWGSMLEVHTKQHYAYRQEQSANAYSNMQLSSGNSLQALSRQGGHDFLSTEKGNVVAQQTIQQIDTNPGMDDETFQKASIKSFTANVQSGNFVYGNLFRKSQVYASLPADQKAKLDQVQDRAETQALQKMELSDFGVRKANLVSQMRYGTISLNEGLRQAQALNAEVSQSTGIAAPFVTGTQLQGMIEGNNSAMIRAADKIQAKQDKAQEANDKLQAKATDIRNAVGMANGGAANTAIAAGLVTSDEMSLLTAQQFTQIGQSSPEQQAGYLVATNKDGYVSPTIKNQVTAGIRQSDGVGYTNGFDQSLGYYTNLREAGPGGLAAAEAYFGNDAPFMDSVYSMHKAGMPVEAAYDAAKAKPAKLNNIADQAGGYQQGRKAVLNAVNASYTTWVPHWLGGAKPAPYVMNNIANAVATRADQYVGNSWDLNTAVTVAAKNSGVDMIGEDGYIRKPGQMTVAQTIHIPDDAMGPTFENLRDQKLAAIGLDKSNVQSLQRVDDPKTGNVNMYMIVANPDSGAVTAVPFHQDELLGSYNSQVVQKKLKAQRAARFSATLGDQLQNIAY